MPLTTPQLRALEAIFPGDALIAGQEETLPFGKDASRKFAQPLAVVRPETTEQCADLLRLCQEWRMPVYPRGRATNVVGGCVPVTPGVVVSTARMDRILDIDADDFVAVCQPGVVTGALQEAARAKGLLYAPDPASAQFSTLAGNIAMNAGGLRAVKYGCTRDWVLGVTAVLPGGAVLRLGSRCHKDVAGLDLARLFVGSEGTLGLITEATLKLLPLPQAQASLLAVFAQEDQALAAVQGVFRAGILPTAMEYMSGDVLHALGRLGDVPWPDGSAAALLLAIDGSRQALGPDLDALRTAVAPHAPTLLEVADTPEGEDALWSHRRQINQALFVYGPDKAADDIAVPRGKVGLAVRRIRETGQALGIRIITFGHLGDGNIHVNIMHDAADPRQVELVAKAKAEVLALTLSLGGTITGEHGVGLSKLPWIERKVGPQALAAMHAVKAALDPHAIMNPGKGY